AGKEASHVSVATNAVHETTTATDQEGELLKEDMENLRQKLGSMIGKDDCLIKGPTKPSISYFTDESDKKQGKTMKSGRALTAEHDVVLKVPWPHMVVFRLPSNKCVDYDTLSSEEFLFAYYEQMFDAEFAPMQVHLHNHLKGLMEDIKDYPDDWEVIRAYHSLVLSQLERGLLKWSDTARLATLRHKFVFSLVSPKKSAVSPCADYNNGKCSFRGDHSGSKHVCSHCHEAGLGAKTHPKTNCFRLNGYPNKQLPSGGKGEKK
ncbi:MAG: hypothetical protein GY774_21565, partial [Planctomycetes bacterium]|nr:hypothetical protein [Planctomycetota bacterium]